jgi:hypothetical protein
MKTVTLDVRKPADSMADFTRAWKVTALLNAGILVRTEDKRIIFPFEAVKVEFLLHAT